MNKKKKLLLSLGSVATVPITAVVVVSCGSDNALNLKEAQILAIRFVSNIHAPLIEDQETFIKVISLITAFDAAKAKAITAIKGASTIAKVNELASSITNGTEIQKVWTALHKIYVGLTLQSLPEDSLVGITIDSDKENNDDAFSIEKIINALNVIDGISGIVANDVNLDTSKAGELKIRIKNYGDDKVITLTRFKVTT